jgi:MFS transporter, AAHS family, 3-hydroxyphenylpropionic acid transporter
MAMTERRVAIIIAICFLTALMEGLDLQAIGVATPLMAPEFGLGARQLGVILSSSPFGLLLGAIVGGKLADVFGRKVMLAATMAGSGLFTLLTAHVPNVEVLVAVRFVAGIALGGALPNMLSLASEARPENGKVGRVVISFAGMPIGGTLAAVSAAVAATYHQWRPIFYVGGIASLALALAMVLLLQESPRFREAKAATARINWFEALFGDGRLAPTLLIWVFCLCVNLISFLLLNWLPLLNIANGFTPAQASSLQVVYNFTACFGSIAVGWVMDARPGRWVLGGCYVGVALCFLALAAGGSDFLRTAVILTLIGAFLYGSIYIVYGLIPGVYPTMVRGVGTGASFAAGRIGSIIGPMLAGSILGAGHSGAVVLEALLPITALAGVTAVALVWRSSQRGAPVTASAAAAP